MDMAALLLSSLFTGFACLCCLLRLFLDGQLVGQISNTSVNYGDDGTQLLVPGGAPAALSGPIHLCTRADNNNTRYFDGKIAYLGEDMPTTRCT